MTEEQQVKIDELDKKITLEIEKIEADKKAKEEAEKNKSISPKQAQEILYQKVGTHLSYEYAGDVGPNFNVYAESGINFYLFYPSEEGMMLEGAYYVHKKTGKVYEAYSDGVIKAL